MRRFEQGVKEYFEFQVEGSDEIYKIPFATSMTNKQIIEFQGIGEDYARQIAWLKNFMGDAVDDLTLIETSAILKAWVSASKDSGAEVGE